MLKGRVRGSVEERSRWSGSGSRGDEKRGICQIAYFHHHFET